MTIGQRIALAEAMIDATSSSPEEAAERKAQARAMTRSMAAAGVYGKDEQDEALAAYRREADADLAREIALGVAADVEDPEDDAFDSSAYAPFMMPGEVGDDTSGEERAGHLDGLIAQDDDCTCRTYATASGSGDGYGGNATDTSGCPVHDPDLDPFDGLTLGGEGCSVQ